MTPPFEHAPQQVPDMTRTARKTASVAAALNKSSRLAIVSTTIHGAQGYLPFDRLAAVSAFSEVFFVIAGDLKSKPFDTAPFRCRVEYLTPEYQARFACSEAIGWNKIMRRNLALLRAIELRPDYILLIDDDNAPAHDYFTKWHAILSTPATQVVKAPRTAAEPAWHNYLETSDAKIRMYPRGYPVALRKDYETRIVTSKPIQPSKIGVFQGISLGDPDIDAMTRIVYPCPISKVSDTNYCLRGVWSPYNTQNTLLTPILFPLGFVWPHCGRYDDIYSSYVWQQLLFNNDMYAHVGDPVNKQTRGVRSDLKDLANEVEGYQHAHEVWTSVRTIKETNPIKFLQALAALSGNDIIARHREFFRAFLRDLERVSFA